MGRTETDTNRFFEILELYDNLAEDACRFDSELWDRLIRLRQQVQLKSVFVVKAVETKRLEEACNP